MRADIFLLFLTNTLIISAPNGGPLGPIKIHQITKCDPDVNLIKMKADLVPVGSTDSVSLSFDLPIDFDNNFTISLYASKWENNRWVPQSYTVQKEPAFRFFQQYVRRIYDKIRSAFVPKIDDPFLIKKGPRKLERFQASFTEIDTPQSVYGRFLADFFLAVGNEDYACMRVEVELFPPDVASAGKLL